MLYVTFLVTTQSEERNGISGWFASQAEADADADAIVSI